MKAWNIKGFHALPISESMEYLQKEPSARASSSQLLHHPLLAGHAAVDLAAWLRDAIACLPPKDEPHNDDDGGGSMDVEALSAGA